jgi:hypothetical protein
MAFVTRILLMPFTELDYGTGVPPYLLILYQAFQLSEKHWTIKEIDGS